MLALYTRLIFYFRTTKRSYLSRLKALPLVELVVLVLGGLLCDLEEDSRVAHHQDHQRNKKVYKGPVENKG